MIKKGQVMADPPDPPPVFFLFQFGPVIDRVAPALACPGKIIRRASADEPRDKIIVEFEKPRMAPHIGTVVIDVNRDVPDDAHAIALRVLF